MNRPWMPLYVADYLADTRGLNAAEHGAYLLLIMHYWQTGGLPDDDKQLARIAAMSPAEWRKCRPTIAPFFADGWKHKRVEHELTEAARISAAGRKGGLASAEARRNKPSTTVERPLNDHGNDPPTKPQALQSPSVTNVTGADAPADPKAAYFRRAREVLGSGSGALIAKLLRAQGNEDDPKAIAKARAHIETASTKADAAEWIGRVLKPRNGTAPLTEAGNLWPEGIV